jgi:hypothetical protein
MAVAANDLTLVYLHLDERERSRAADEGRHFARLLRDMVELEDNGVVLPAIDARHTAEPFEDVFACLLPSGVL